MVETIFDYVQLSQSLDAFDMRHYINYNNTQHIN